MCKILINVHNNPTIRYAELTSQHPLKILFENPLYTITSETISEDIFPFMDLTT